MNGHHETCLLYFIFLQQTFCKPFLMIGVVNINNDMIIFGESRDAHEVVRHNQESSLKTFSLKHCPNSSKSLTATYEQQGIMERRLKPRKDEHRTAELLRKSLRKMAQSGTERVSRDHWES